MEKNETEKLYSLDVQNRIFRAVIRKRSVRRIIIRVSLKNEITVHCPLTCSFSECYRYLKEHQDWLEKVILRQEANNQIMEADACMRFEKVWIQGILYTIIRKDDLPVPFLIESDKLYVKEHLDKVLEGIRFRLKDNIIEEFNACLHSFSPFISQKPYLQIKKLKSRWGSCNYRTGRIAINSMLIHVPKELLHYVMVHEFAHLLYPNHSREFHAFVAECIPTFRKAEKALKAYSFLLRM